MFSPAPLAPAVPKVASGRGVCSGGLRAARASSGMSMRKVVEEVSGETRGEVFCWASSF